MTFVKNLDTLPDVECFAILMIDGVWIPGDERSRTAPGHGYPERTEHFPSLQVFTDEKEWLDKINEYSNSTFGRKQFKAFVMRPVTIKNEVKVDYA